MFRFSNLNFVVKKQTKNLFPIASFSFKTSQNLKINNKFVFKFNPKLVFRHEKFKNNKICKKQFFSKSISSSTSSSISSISSISSLNNESIKIESLISKYLKVINKIKNQTSLKKFIAELMEGIMLIVAHSIEVLATLDQSMGRKPEKSFLKAILFGFYLLFLYTMLSVLMAICTVLSELISRGLVASPAEQPLSPENQQFHVVASATAVLLCIAACHTGGLWNRYVALSIWVAAASASAWRFYQQRLVVKRLREQSQRKKPKFLSKLWNTLASGGQQRNGDEKHSRGAVYRDNSPDNAYCAHGVVVVGRAKPKNAKERLLWMFGLHDFAPEVFDALCAHERGHVKSATFITIINLILMRGARSIPHQTNIRFKKRFRHSAAGYMRLPFQFVVWCGTIYTLSKAWTGTAWLSELIADMNAGEQGTAAIPLLQGKCSDHSEPDKLRCQRTHCPYRGGKGMYAHPPLSWREEAFRWGRRADESDLHVEWLFRVPQYVCLDFLWPLLFPIDE